MRKSTALIIAFAFLLNFVSPSFSRAQELVLPTPGTMVYLSPSFNPPILKGIKVHPENPFKFDFILDQGSVIAKDGVIASEAKQSLKNESTKLIKYFLASLTTLEKDMWVD